MRRQLVCALAATAVILATTAAIGAVDMTGTWAICGDCRVGGVCDPLGPGPTDVDQ